MSEPMPPPARKPRHPALIAVNVIVSVLIAMFLFSLLFGRNYIFIEPGHRARCANNLHQIWITLNAYVQDDGGRFQFTGTVSESANKHFALVFPKWTRNERIFVCPGAGPRGYHADNKLDDELSRGLSEMLASGKSHPSECSPAEMESQGFSETLGPGENCYAYAFGLGGRETQDSPLTCDQLADCRIARQRWALRGVGSNHRAGGNVLYVDGHVEFFTASTEGHLPPKRPKMKAMMDGRVCDPANAAPAPVDR